MNGLSGGSISGRASVAPTKQPSGQLSNAKDRAYEQASRLEDMVNQLESWLLAWRGPVPEAAVGDCKPPQIDCQLSDWHATLDRQTRVLDKLSLLVTEIYSL